MKKVIALLVSLALVLCMVACGGSDEKETTTKATEATTKATEATTKATEAEKEDTTEAPTEDAKKFNGEKIVVQMYGSNPDQTGAERVWGKINEYFLDKYNIDVEMNGITWGNYVTNLNLALSAGEQIDVFQSGALGFTTCINNDFLYDMYENDLIQTYGQGILEIVDECYLQGCTRDGHLYGTSTMRDMAVGMWAIVVANQYLEGINFDFSTIDTTICNRVTLEWIEDLFTTLHEAYPDLDVIYPYGYSLMNQKFVYDPIGGDNFGVMLDPVNSIEITDLFSSDTFMDYCKLMRKWHDLGWINAEAATAPESEQGATAMKAGTLISNTTGGKPGMPNQSSSGMGFPCTIFQLGEDFCRAEQATVAAWSICSYTEHPEAAMTILNDMYSDPVFTNLFLWGEEGKEFVFTEDGHIDYPEGLDRSTIEYRGTAAWAMPCEYNTYVFVGDALDLWEQTVEFNKTSQKSKGLGFAFDNSELSAEYTALSNSIDQYINSLMFGAVDPEENVPKLVDSLNASGLETYIAEKSRQINEWAAANGIK